MTPTAAARPASVPAAGGSWRMGPVLLDEVAGTSVAVAASSARLAKVGDSLRQILDGDEGKIQQQKTINDSMCTRAVCDWRLAAHMM